MTRPLEGDTEAIVAHIWRSLESGWGLSHHESKIKHNGHRLDFFDVTTKETLDIVKGGGRFELDAIPPLIKAVVTLGADDQVRSLWVSPTVGNPFMAHYGPPGAPGPTAPPIHMTPEQQDAVFLQRAPMTTVLETQRLFVTPNSAETRVDSLIMALLQHATGQYLTIQMSLVVEIRKALRAAFPDIDMNAILQFDDPETQWLIREIMLRFSPSGYRPVTFITSNAWGRPVPHIPVKVDDPEAAILANWHGRFEAVNKIGRRLWSDIFAGFRQPVTNDLIAMHLAMRWPPRPGVTPQERAVNIARKDGELMGLGPMQGLLVLSMVTGVLGTELLEDQRLAPLLVIMAESSSNPITGSVGPSGVIAQDQMISLQNRLQMSGQFAERQLTIFANDGGTANNCLFICLIQSALKDYTSTHPEKVQQARDALVEEFPHVDLDSGLIHDSAPAIWLRQHIWREHGNGLSRMVIFVAPGVDGVPALNFVDSGRHSGAPVVIADWGLHFDSVRNDSGQSLIWHLAELAVDAAISPDIMEYIDPVINRIATQVSLRWPAIASGQALLPYCEQILLADPALRDLREQGDMRRFDVLQSAVNVGIESIVQSLLDCERMDEAKALGRELMKHWIREPLGDGEVFIERLVKNESSLRCLPLDERRMALSIVANLPLEFVADCHATEFPPYPFVSTLAAEIPREPYEQPRDRAERMSAWLDVTPNNSVFPGRQTVISAAARVPLQQVFDDHRIRMAEAVVGVM